VKIILTEEGRAGCEKGLAPVQVQWQVFTLTVLKFIILLPDSKINLIGIGCEVD
jgi:hypothetical protein